jgi:Co/Zn/Cd efflux system component
VQIFASVKSKSLAIVASTLESLLDLIAGVILLFTRWAMKRENVYKYPIGKLRVQPVGIVIFAAIMATLGIALLAYLCVWEGIGVVASLEGTVSVQSCLQVPLIKACFNAELRNPEMQQN